MKTKPILIYGGTFDPIHNGHLIVVRAVAEQLDVERIILVPSANPPHKLDKAVTDARHRLAMTHLAVENDPLFEVSDCELHRRGPSYTLLTLNYFQEKYSNQKLYWLIGADTILDLPNWYEIGKLADACQIVTAGRPGYDLQNLQELEGVLTTEQLHRFKKHILSTPLIEISATDIRKRVRENLPISFMLPEKVVQYIKDCKIYAME